MQAIPLLLLVFLATDTDDAAVRKEMRLLEGNWKVVAQEMNGKKVPEKEFLEQVIFSKAPWDAGKKKEADVLTYTLDLTKSPKTISATMVEGKNKRILSGIYALDGDTLKICLCVGQETPPTEFKTAPGMNAMLIELKREKR